MRIILIGAVQFSRSALLRLLELEAEIVGVVTRSASPFNADYAPLAPLCEQHGIPVLFSAKLAKPEHVQWLRDRAPDVIFCWGWSHLLPREVLQLPPLGVVGYHPAALPKNRGRHPVVWALALGLEETASTFFFMAEEADSGDLLNQRGLAIAYRDDARSLYQRLTEVALSQIEEFLPQLAEQRAPRAPQDHSLANNWRKRGLMDGWIDFRMGSRQIYNLVRALTRPYVGAHITRASQPCKVWKVRETGPQPRNLEPGKVLRVDGSLVWVRCGVGSLVLEEHELVSLPLVGEYF